VIRPRRDLGRRGERRAARWLRRRGYRIVGRNLRIGRDEADLIALTPDGATVVVVEVKTRRGDFAPPEQAVGPHKRRCLERLAARLHQRYEFAGRAMRFDVIAIAWPEDRAPQITHIEGAFDARPR
jgi:putative endonuclease